MHVLLKLGSARVAAIVLVLAGTVAAVRAEPVVSPKPEDPRAFRALHERAQAYLEKGDARAALDSLGPALLAHPRAEPLHRLAGIAAFRLRLLERARSEFEAAIRLVPDFPFNYLKLASLELCERHDCAAADRVLARLWARLPEDTGSREQAADLYARCGAPERAIDLELALVRLDSKRAWLHRFRAGQIYHAAGRWQDARILEARALAEGPSDRAELPAQLGATLRRLGDAPGAVRQYRAALARHPDPALALRLRKELSELGAGASGPIRLRDMK